VFLPCKSGETVQNSGKIGANPLAVVRLCDFSRSDARTDRNPSWLIVLAASDAD
jgi:hypothetical protein